MPMSIAMYAAFVFTVVLLVTNAYFLLGGLPLLVPKHDVPLDARFIGAFFNVYFNVAFWAALGAAMSYALWGRFLFGAGAAAIAGVAVLLLRRLLPVLRNIAAASKRTTRVRFNASKSCTRPHCSSSSGNWC